MTLLAIDPGTSKRGGGCACALFTDAGALEALGYARPGALWAPPHPPTAVLIEKPQVRFAEGISKMQSVLELAWQGALVAGAYRERYGATLAELTPTEWKGAQPKPVTHGRALRVLTPAEQELAGGAAARNAIDAAKRAGARDRWSKPGARYCTGYDHDAWDALSLGLTHLGRL